MGNGYRGTYSGAARDKKMADLKRRLNLAKAARNRTEVTRLTADLRKLGQSL
jgi:hypothetical protein